MSGVLDGWHTADELRGDYVALVPLSDHHASGALVAADDDEVFRWLPVARPTGAVEAEELVRRYLGMEGVVAWAQIDQSTHNFAGMTTFYDINPDQRTVAIGWTWLGRKYWRTGINTEAKLLLLTHAFETLQCVRVVWHTDINNERSQAAIARIGGVREGNLRKHKRRRDGSWRDTVIFSMTDDEWPVAKDALERRLVRSLNRC